MRKITQYNGQIINPDSDYPDGDLKDDTSPGADDGTIIDRKSNADIQQFFMKLMRESGIVANGLPDNEYNGLQLFQALRHAALPWRSYMFNLIQGGTFDPSYFQYVVNTTKSIVWVRTGVGVYTGTLSGAGTADFPTSGTILLISGSSTGLIQASRTSSSVITIETFTSLGVPADDVMTNTFLEIRTLY